MKAYILRCRPGSHFHFGRMALDSNSALHDSSDVFHSDTLFSALINIVSSFSTPIETESVVQLFRRDNEAVRLSSGMFCLSHGDQDVLLLPRPDHFSLRMKASRIKQFSRITFISKKLWETGLTPDHNEWESRVTIIGGKFALLEHEVRGWELHKRLAVAHSLQTLPKVHARKKEQEDAFYFQTNVVFPENPDSAFDMHYYFLLDDKSVTPADADAFARLNTAITLLPYSGIGGERSSGCGLFISIEEKEFNLEAFDHEGYITLGLTVPMDHDDIERLEYYHTLFRGGRNTREGFLLRRIRMIAEGAYSTEPVKGHIPNIGDKSHSDFPFWRYGKPICIPANRQTLPKTY